MRYLILENVGMFWVTARCMSQARTWSRCLPAPKSYQVYKPLHILCLHWLDVQCQTLSRGQRSKHLSVTTFALSNDPTEKKKSSLTPRALMISRSPVLRNANSIIFCLTSEKLCTSDYRHIGVYCNLSYSSTVTGSGIIKDYSSVYTFLIIHWYPVFLLCGVNWGDVWYPKCLWPITKLIIFITLNLRGNK